MLNLKEDAVFIEIPERLRTLGDFKNLQLNLLDRGFRWCGGETEPLDVVVRHLALNFHPKYPKADLRGKMCGTDLVVTDETYDSLLENGFEISYEHFVDTLMKLPKVV